MPEGAVLGVDPGTRKCGLAQLDEHGTVTRRAVVAREALAGTVRQWAAEVRLERVALGSRTGSAEVRGELATALPGVDIELVPEHRSTEEARALYWQYHPPRGWRRLVPRGMLVPPEPVDGYAAEVLARRSRAGRRLCP